MIGFGFGEPVKTQKPKSSLAGKPAENSKAQQDTEKIIDMVLPLIRPQGPSRKDEVKPKKPVEALKSKPASKALFGMFDDLDEAPEPTPKKREAKAASKLFGFGKLGGKLSKDKKAAAPSQPEPKEAAPTKFAKKSFGFGFEEPSTSKLFKPKPAVAASKETDKYKALFSGNPFLQKPKLAKTLIATPSKFDIRNEPAVPEKRGRGRPRKDPDAAPTAPAKAKTQPLGVRKTFL